MLEVFRNNHFVNTLLLIPYALFLRAVPLFFGNLEEIPTEGIWTTWLFGETIEVTLFNQLLAIVLIFLQAAMINRLIIKNRVTNEITLFPGVFYILLTSFFPSLTVLSSALIANTFILIGLAELFAAHRKLKTAELIFSTGFWFSCAALTYHGYFVMLIFPILGLSTLRTVKWINVAQFLIGSMTPFLIIIMISFLIDKTFLPVLAPLTESLGIYSFTFDKTWINIGQVVFFLLWILTALLQYNGFTIKKNIHAQKKVDLFFWFMGFVLICTFFRSVYNEQLWMPLLIPLSVMLAMTFIRIRTKLAAEMIHFLLLICLFSIQVLFFF